MQTSSQRGQNIAGNFGANAPEDTGRVHQGRKKSGSNKIETMHKLWLDCRARFLSATMAPDNCSQA